MRKFLAVFALVALVAVFCSVSLAQVPIPIVLTNDDNPSGNSGTAYHLNTNGTMTLVKKLSTGGFGLGGGFFGATGQAVTGNGHCVFITNTGSDTITSFASPSYAKTGDAGIPGMFTGAGAGGSVALTPNGKYLYSGNSGTFNISAWGVNANCTLTHIADYTPSVGADLTGFVGVAPNGGALVVPAVDFEAAEIFKINANGTLTDVNNVNWVNVGNCPNVGCFPTGMDFTNDSKVVVFGNATTGAPSALSANIGATGLTNPLYWDLTNTAGVQNDNVPWFSKTGAAGNGPLYFGMSGFSTGIPSGEVTTAFKESPLSITVTNSTLVPNAANFQGSIRTVGALMVLAEYPNVIQSAQVNANGSLTLGPATTDPNAGGLLSLEVIPKTR